MKNDKLKSLLLKLENLEPKIDASDENDFTKVNDSFAIQLIGGLGGTNSVCSNNQSCRKNEVCHGNSGCRTNESCGGNIACSANNACQIIEG
ncbi:MAG: hypothetical protein O9282_14835 [Flavobacterium sp.]|uniref:hypothetical protein n=1 Tax=Flavobacterium sp. TaxID=239 RepID=UPI0022C0D6CE|nr:hypothetical protein [Flavobacterium sp.]MCZ8023865.1 hypothetical protein [Cytophagales bacterium]MCZ8332583.1 hypothetical protein [Flavobacterium sp.]